MELSAELDLLRSYNYSIADKYQRGIDTTREATIAKLTAGRPSARLPMPACSTTVAWVTSRKRGLLDSSVTTARRRLEEELTR